MGLLALPALWAGKGEEVILQLMTDAVSTIVPIEVIYARVQLPPLHAPVPLFRQEREALGRHIPLQWQGFVDSCNRQTSRSAVVDSPLGVLTTVRFLMSAGSKGESIWFGLTGKVATTMNQMAFIHAAVSLCTTGLNTARIDYDRARANRSKDEFLAMLGHELRNPLAPIVTSLAIIKLKGSGQLVKEHAVITRQVGHLSRLVDDLLDITRITRGKVDLRLEVFDLRDAVSEAVESVLPLITEMKHTLTVNPASQNTLVNGDPQRIRQALMNLLINAAKYTLPGGNISITSAQDAGTASVCIRDDGTGIDSDLLPRVFDLFEQGMTTIDRSRGGLGIGLALVKKLIDLHGGKASAHSEGLGYGSSFTIRLPLFKPTSEVMQAPINPVLDARPAAGQRIMVVDDNADALDALEELLTCYGFEVLAARHPEEALGKASAFGPDAIILDIGLPGMDGYELAARLREQQSTKMATAQFIALTGYGQATDKARALAAGFHSHLVKPVDIDELLAAINPSR